MTGVETSSCAERGDGGERLACNDAGTADETEAVTRRVATLEAVAENLRTDLATIADRDLPLLKGTLRALTNEDVDAVDDLPDAGREFGDRIDRLEERLVAVERRLDRLGDLDRERTSKEEKFAAVLTFAENKRNGSVKVALSPQEVKGCTGVSRRYAYELIDEMGEAVEGVEVREARQVQTGSGTERKGKALLVDCDLVHHNGGGVNEFTTGGGSDDGG
jgi:hypothetical protein